MPPRKAEKTRNNKIKIANEVIKEKEKLKVVAARHGIAISTLHGWVQSVRSGTLSEEHNNQRKRAKMGLYPDIEERLVAYIQLRAEKYTHDGLPLSPAILRTRAKQIANALAKEHPSKKEHYSSFQASNGWFEKMQRRQDVHVRTLHGEGSEMSIEEAAPLMRKFREEVLAAGVYDPRFIFNADETGLFYQCLPNRTYTVGKDHKARGVKSMAAKPRITLITTSSAAGEKMPLLAVGKSAYPACFADGQDGKPPVEYTSQSRAWCDRDVACLFLRKFIKWKRARHGRQKVVLIWDNAPGHTAATHPFEDELVVLALPPNVTALHQPMDQGVIAALKRRYKARVLENLIAVYDNATSLREAQAKLKKAKRGRVGLRHGRAPNVLDALCIIKEEWDQLSEEGIRNCWRRADCLPSSITTMPQDMPDSSGDDNVQEADSIDLAATQLSHMLERVSIEDVPAEIQEFSLEGLSAWRGVDDNVDVQNEVIEHELDSLIRPLILGDDARDQEPADEEGPEEARATPTEVFQALNVVSRFIAKEPQSPSTQAMAQLFSKARQKVEQHLRDKKKQQTKLHSFFSHS